MGVPDPGIASVMRALLECVEEEMAESSIELPGFRAVHWGEVPYDHVGFESGCDGELFVRFVQSFVTDQFPAPAETLTTGRPRFAYDLEVGAIRCFPGLDDNGSAPEPPALSASVDQANADMRAIRRAICKCIPMQGDREFVLGAYTPYGPEGGAYGGVWPITVGGPRR